MTNATIRRLSFIDAPYTWGLRIANAEKQKFSAFVESLKINIPASGRKWDVASKQWMILDAYVELLQHLLTRYGLTFTIDTSTTGHNGQSSGAGHRQVTSRERAAAELYLLPNAPADVITAVFRVLAKKYHPDAGGDTELMQRLNAAVEVLRQ